MEKIEQLFEELTKNNPLEILSEFIAPHLIGEEWKDIRKAILLMMATQNDGQQRMRLHTLLWGKAGTGKTELLLSLQKLFGGIIVNAEHTSKVGLVGDARGGMTPGLLADYDGNLVLLDELDKMSGKDQAGLLQAMEEGYYTIVKGRHRERFKAEVRVVATANNINKITKPLLDRFDFIFEVRTMPREERAEGVKTIVENFFGNGEKKGHKVLRAYLNWISDFEPMIEEGDTPIVVEMLKRYILLTKTAIDEVSYRNLELSILRIAYAMAKLEKSNIKPKYVEEAIVFKDRMLKRLVGVVDGGGY
ncbi:MAG: hypothetical protein DRP18_04080 [Candidatus Aenigmatarchaeota archaeon]|nr:MAG: hypothetical protein DRP18_04080 [Candidatus Aenigmarchaeota archaeon]